MTGPLLTLEAANMFCGGAAVGAASNHLRLTNVRLPAMEEVYLDHRPGGAPVAIEIDVMMAKFQCDFTLAGWSPQVASLISAWQSAENQFWFYGALRDRVIDDGLPSIAQAEIKIYGRLGKASPTPWQRGNLHSWDYSIRSIIQYRLTVGGNILYDWDFFNNTFSVQQYSPTS